jgi:hypothetical protein
MNFAITGGPSPILRDAALGFSSLRPLELQSQVVPSIPIPVQLCEGDAFSAHFFWEFLPTNQTWEGFRETRVPSPLKRGELLQLQLAHICFRTAQSHPVHLLGTCFAPQ